MGPILHNFQLILDDISETRLSEPFIIGGDFNVSIGEDSSCIDDFLEGTVITSRRLLPSSESRRGTNLRGQNISNLMKSNGMLLLNGRTPGDSSATYTYLGARGRRITDFTSLDLLNLSMISSSNRPPSLPTTFHYHSTFLAPTGTSPLLQSHFPKPRVSYGMGSLARVLVHSLPPKNSRYL